MVVEPQKVVDVPQVVSETTYRFSLLSGTVRFMSDLGYTIYEKVFPRKKERLIEYEDKIFQHLNCTMYRYHVKIERGEKIWTVASVPKEVMQLYRKDELTSDQLEFYHLNQHPVLLIHGFCGGSGFWCMNIESIHNIGTAVFAIDMPGFGHSTRVEFPPDCEGTENMFLDCFDQWRIAMGFEKMILIGHSMGGYLTAAYSLKYPLHVAHAVMVDAWGFPDLKETVTYVMKQSATGTVSRKLVNATGWMRVLAYLLRPFSPVQMMRTIGPVFASKVMRLIRPHFFENYERVHGSNSYETVANYIYWINSFKPTGEDALRNIAHPVGWAKNPILSRISHLSEDVSLTFIYGSRSWVSPKSGYSAKKILANNYVKVYVVDNAGHHVYADKPDIFNRIIKKTVHRTHYSMCYPKITSEIIQNKHTLYPKRTYNSATSESSSCSFHHTRINSDNCSDCGSSSFSSLESN